MNLSPEYLMKTWLPKSTHKHRTFPLLIVLPV